MPQWLLGTTRTATIICPVVVCNGKLRESNAKRLPAGYFAFVAFAIRHPPTGYFGASGRPLGHWVHWLFEIRLSENYLLFKSVKEAQWPALNSTAEIKQ